MFLIQIDKDNLPMFDFQLELIDILKTEAWLNNTNDVNFILIHTADEGFNIIETDKDGIDIAKTKYIPIGSIEFVNAFLNRYFNTKVKVFNVPASICNNFKYVKRLYKKNLSIDEVSKVLEDHKLLTFIIKDSNNSKSIIDICSYTNKSILQCLDKNIRLDVSTYLDDVVAEYRLFTSGNVIWDIKKYLGDWIYTYNLSIEFLVSLVHELNDDPTLPKDKVIDIGILSDGSVFLLEVHPFISCGTYGFSNKSLPRILKRAYLWQTEN